MPPPEGLPEIAQHTVSIYQYLSSLGVGGTIAAILFFFYRRDVKNYVELWQAAEARAQKQTELMIVVVRENAIAFSQNSEVVKSLHRRLDRYEDTIESSPTASEDMTPRRRGRTG